jgi:hypothetical protein
MACGTKSPTLISKLFSSVPTLTVVEVDEISDPIKSPSSTPILILVEVGETIDSIEVPLLTPISIFVEVDVVTDILVSLIL